MIILGTTMIVFAGDGYVVSCNMATTSAVWFIRLWTVLAPYCALALIRRADVEDAELKKNFGEKWDAYRRSVPYKFIPYFV